MRRDRSSIGSSTIGRCATRSYSSLPTSRTCLKVNFFFWEMQVSHESPDRGCPGDSVGLRPLPVLSAALFRCATKMLATQHPRDQLVPRKRPDSVTTRDSRYSRTIQVQPDDLYIRWERTMGSGSSSTPWSHNFCLKIHLFSLLPSTAK